MLPFICLSLFSCLIALGIYGLTIYDIDFDIEDFVKPHFYLQDAIDIKDEYFSETGEMIIFASIDEDFEKEEVQLKW